MATLESELSIPTGATLTPSILSSSTLHLSPYDGTPSTSIPILPSSSLRVSSTPPPRCLIIGRQASACDVRLDHKSISRRHAALYYVLSSLQLLDLSGKKGLFVNGHRVSRDGTVALKDGDSIRFGSCESVIVVETVRLEEDVDQEAAFSSEGATRTERVEQIAAMMASLDETLDYTPYRAPSPTPEEVLAASSTLDTCHPPSLPISHSITISTSPKTLTSLSLNPAGSRLLAGSTDGILRLYDFGGMNSSHRSFREILVEDGYPIRAVCHSPSGDKFVVSCGSATPSIFDRDGNCLIKFVKGDVYVTDMKQTKGHVATVTGVDWHPFEKEWVMTCSLDGSVRFWDVMKGKTTFDALVCAKDRVYRLKDRKGKRTGVSCAAFHPKGRIFAAGTSCGSLQIWDASKVSVAPKYVKWGAHGNTNVNSIQFDTTGETILTRGQDDVICVWDLSSFIKMGKAVEPKVRIPNITSFYDMGNSAFSPDGTVLVAGINSKSTDTPTASLTFHDIHNNKHLHQIHLPPTKNTHVNVVFTTWHPKLNQLFLAMSDGTVRIYYSPLMSQNGALLSSSRRAHVPDALSLLLKSRAANTSSITSLDSIVTPHALPMFRTEKQQTAKRKQNDISLNINQTKQPEAPSSNKMKTGGLTSASVNFTQFFMQNKIESEKRSGVGEKNIAGMDPREELFKYRTGEKSFVDKAYEECGKGELAKTTVEEEVEEDQRRDRER